jgi:hypothetical protein
MKINNRKIDCTESTPLKLENEDTIDLSLRQLGGSKYKQQVTLPEEEDYTSDQDELEVNPSTERENWYQHAELVGAFLVLPVIWRK